MNVAFTWTQQSEKDGKDDRNKPQAQSHECGIHPDLAKGKDDKDHMNTPEAQSLEYRIHLDLAKGKRWQR